MRNPKHGKDEQTWPYPLRPHFAKAPKPALSGKRHAPGALPPLHCYGRLAVPPEELGEDEVDDDGNTLACEGRKAAQGTPVMRRPPYKTAP